MGIVVKEPNRGAMVRSFFPDEVEQIYHMRTLLQREAARLIPLPASPGLWRTLRRLQQAHAAAVDRRELLKVFHLNNEFHETLFAACGNPWLCESIRQFSWMAYAIRCYRIADPGFQIQASDEHAQMIAAMETGDRKGLMKLCVEHIMRSKNVYLEDQRRLA
jgi:DNA-binding GntR family transcriptional regulator